MSYRPIRKMQRKARKALQKINRDIEKDSLWQGRFVIRQVGKQFLKHEDNSGYKVCYTLAVVDKKTGNYILAYVDDYAIENKWKLFVLMNNFIIDDVKVWDEVPNPRDPAFKFNWINYPVVLKNKISVKRI